ncbi:MAG: GDYXXLXY domain-containing protein [Paenibacillaceae bacterium]|nr:GDYXXLXY domain-containing protein [Paenibacillaceae bacterium]
MNAQRIRIALIVLVSAQLLVIGGVTASYYAASVYGKEVRIATIPIDPRDLFYGDYVVLRYSLNTFSSKDWHGAAPPKKGMAVYAWLREKDGLFEASRFSDTPPPDGTPALRGRIVQKQSWNDQVDVVYGIERFYVPEGTGADIEAYAGRAIASVRIALWGQSYLESVAPRP